MFCPILPEFHVNRTVQGAPARAKGIYAARLMVPAVAVSVCCILWFPSAYGWLSVLLLPPAYLLSRLQHRAAGWAIHRHYFIFQFRSIQKHLVIVPIRHVRALALSRSIAQK